MINFNFSVLFSKVRMFLFDSLFYGLCFFSEYLGRSYKFLKLRFNDFQLAFNKGEQALDPREDTLMSYLI